MRSPYVRAPCAHRYALIITRSVAAESQDTLSSVVSSPDLAHHTAVVPGLASVMTKSGLPEWTRSKVRAPLWAQLRSSLSVLCTASAKSAPSSPSPFSTSTR